MSVYKAQVVLENVSGLPEDRVINDLFFDETPAIDFDEVAQVIDDFFNVAPAGGPTIRGQTPAVAEMLSAELSTVANAAEIRFYELPATPGVLGSPAAVRNFTLAGAPLFDAGGNSNLPGEVALALSFNAILTDIPETQANPSPPPAVIRPRARRRGRIFLGPWLTVVLNDIAPAAAVQRPLAAVGTVMRLSAVQTLPSASSAGWMVFSETDWVARGVVNVSTDNAFDTIRSRGVAPSARSETAI